MSKQEMIKFTEIQAYVNWWMDINNVQISHVHECSEVNKDGVNNNWIALNGLKMKVWIDSSYPTNLLNLKDLCCADSATYDYKISANQAKVAVKRHLYDRAKENLLENNNDNLFDFKHKVSDSTV